MAITIDGQIYRNLQEQVQYLTDLTEDIKPYVAGTGITISGQTIAIDPSVYDEITEAEGIANTANSNATAAQTAAETAQTAATQAQNRADSAYNLANIADTATEQNASRIQIIEDTAPQFSLEGTTLTITLPE